MASERQRAYCFGAALVMCTVLGLVPRLWIALHQFIEYDGWWHVFISRQPLWFNFLAEVATTAHPPLYFLTLRAAQEILGYNRLAYRFVSLAAGIMTIPLVGVIARRLGCSRRASVLAALVVAVSESATIISCEVRSYSLALLFVLVAFVFLAELLTGTPDRWTIVILAASSGAAVATHYFGFLLVAAELTMIIVATAFPDARLRIRSSVTPLAIGMTGLVVAGMISLYVLQVRRFAGRLNHLPAFFFDANAPESAPAFFLRNLRSFVNLFSPAANRGSIALVVACAVGVLLGAGAVSLRRGPRWPAATAALFALLLFSGIVAGSFAGLYPFGGDLRQQFFFFPFLCLGLIGAMDFAVRSPRLKTIATIILSLACIGHGLRWWNSFPILDSELFTSEYRIFNRSFGGDRAIVVDQFNVIVLFAHMHDRPWRLVRRWPPERMKEYSVGRDVRVIRDRAIWNYDVMRQSDFLRLRYEAEVAGAASFALFALRQVPPDPAVNPVAYAERVRVNARAARLLPQTVVISGYDVFGRFLVPANSGAAAGPGGGFLAPKPVHKHR